MSRGTYAVPDTAEFTPFHGAAPALWTRRCAACRGIPPRRPFGLELAASVRVFTVRAMGADSHRRIGPMILRYGLVSSLR